MSNYVLICAGQCGNQLGYEVLDQIDQHLTEDALGIRPLAPAPTKTKVDKKRAVIAEQIDNSIAENSASLLHNSVFGNAEQNFARCVCLDTEPKVIDNCLAKRKNISRLNVKGSLYSPWLYDTKSIAYRHGGAGNNWSLGYQMAGGDFAQVILDSVRRQLEMVDAVPCLVFLHSLAGGTGSGLGTRVSELCEDEFSECFTTNIMVAPHHFGEVVVQHYNALLCLSKVQAASKSLILLENEMAQVLCKQMRGIERPALSDLNIVLSNHIVPILLPKVRDRSPYGTLFHHFSDDIIHMTAHPRYPFLNIKLTPQTSKMSVDYTFDHWPTLLKTIQRMQLSGAYSERNISRSIKSLGNHYSSSEDYIHTRLAGIDENDSADIKPSSSVYRSPQEVAAELGLVRSLASTITCHGESADEYIRQIKDEMSNNNSAGGGEGSVLSTPTKASTSRTSSTQQIAQIFDAYTASHSSLYHLAGDEPFNCNYSAFRLHKYQRSAHVLANDQSMLPILKRAAERSEKMFRTGAYLHQYATYGVETDDFIEAFYNIGTVIRDYESL